jgi:hypothetical protein
MVLYNFYRNAVFVMMLFWYTLNFHFIGSICSSNHIVFHIISCTVG